MCKHHLGFRGGLDFSCLFVFMIHDHKKVGFAVIPLPHCDVIVISFLKIPFSKLFMKNTLISRSGTTLRTRKEGS